jgi:acetyltransferase-like isoleucine patch superfamily enzyme
VTNNTLAHDWFSQPLPSNVTLGPQSWLYSTFSLVHFRSQELMGLKVGRDSGLYNGTFFDLGPNGKVDIGDFCTIVGAIFSTNGYVRVGNYSFIAHEVVIADQFVAAPFEGGARHPRNSAEIIIGDNVWIGARAILYGTVEIGEGAIVGAAAVVNTNIPPYTIFRGNPARQVGVVRR